MRRALPLALLAALAACNTGLDPQYLVKDLRVLAIRAHANDGTAADVTPGDTLHLEALVLNPLGRTPVEVAWYACPPTATDALPPCADPDYLRDPSRLAARAAAGDGAVVPLGTSAEPAPGAPYTMTVSTADARFAPLVAASLEAAVSLALSEPTYACRLYEEIPVVAVATAGDRRELALKQVRLTPRPDSLAGTPVSGAYVLNANPAIDDVVAAPSDVSTCGGGVSLATACASSADCPAGVACASTFGGGVCATPLAAGRLTLCGTWAAGSNQLFNQCGPGGERVAYQESLRWQWFVTAGDFPDAGGVGNATGSDPDFERPSGAFTMWVIVRDGRGGEGWLRRDFAPQ